MSDLVKRLREAAHTYDEYGVHSEIELEAADRIEELEEALQKQEAITKEDVKWMMAYHQWCVMNGCPPSSSNLIAAHDALAGGKKDE